MADHASPDPWDSLAESLGAAPSDNQPARPEPSATPPRSRERQQARRPAAPPPPAGDWDSLAAELGVSGRDQQPTARPPVDRGRGDERTRTDQEPRRPARESSRERVVEPVAGGETGAAADDDHGARPPRPRSTETGEADEGSGQRRRRRGRRGGRGRRRDGESAGGDRDADRRRDAREPAAGDDRPRRFAAEAGRGDEEGRPGDRSLTRDQRDDDHDPDSIRGETESAGIANGDEPGARRESATAGEDGDRPRKRRRRGRRGGRGRGRGREADGAERSDREGAPAGNADHLDDEPLPASYGSRPGATAEDRPRSGGGAAGAGGRGEGEKRGRGRRRRRSGREGGDGRRTGSAAERREPAGDRRDRRRKDESRSSRGRRSDFAPVAGRYEEDDEGLEFLGVEEAARDSETRSRAPVEDDGVLTESGLTSVLDVPSWVEAIGIVIAGNLAARSRSGRGDGGKGR